MDASLVRFNLLNKIIYFCVICLMILLIVMGITRFASNAHSRTITEIEYSIQSLSSQCYALEGSYPVNLQYLEENYGLVLNDQRYFYHFEVLGSNIKPEIQVVEKWSKSNDK